MFNWHITDSKTYPTLEKDSHTLYLLLDTGDIYKDEDEYNKSIIMITKLPTVGDSNILYIIDNNLEGYEWDKIKNTWNKVINSLVSRKLDDNNNDSILVSGEAIKKYVIDRLNDILVENFVNSFTCDKNGLFYKMFNTITTIPLSNLINDVRPNVENNSIDFIDCEGNITPIKLPNGILLTNTDFNTSTNVLSLVMNDGRVVKMTLTDLLDEDSILTHSTTINMIKQPDKKILLSTKLSADSTNLLQVKEDGLYLDRPSNNLYQLEINKQNQVITSNNNGTIKINDISIGNNVISNTPNDKTLVTELAIYNKENEILERMGNGISKSYIVKNGDDINKLSPSGDKIVSQKALYDIMNWKTL